MTAMQPIYHIAPTAEIERAARSGKYAPSTVTAVGYIHCCYGHQLSEVADRLFRGQDNLLLLEIDPARLDAPVVVENLNGGDELFPHLYGQLPMTAVLAIRELRGTPEGGFNMPCIVKG